jgi:beta-galactosidase
VQSEQLGGKSDFGARAKTREGAGKLIGVDDGNAKCHENNNPNRRSAFDGLCLAIVQSICKPGQIQLHATSPSL